MNCVPNLWDTILPSLAPPHLTHTYTRSGWCGTVRNTVRHFNGIVLNIPGLYSRAPRAWAQGKFRATGQPKHMLCHTTDMQERVQEHVQGYSHMCRAAPANKHGPWIPTHASAHKNMPRDHMPQGTISPCIPLAQSHAQHRLTCPSACALKYCKEQSHAKARWHRHLSAGEGMKRLHHPGEEAGAAVIEYEI